MIKVNLQQRKVAVSVVAGSDSAAASGASGLKRLFETLQDSISAGFADGAKRSAVISLIVAIAILIGGSTTIGILKADLIAKVDAEIATVDTKIALLTSELNKTSGYEQIKKNLEADEKTIRTKIETIQELLRDRTLPPKILISLSETIPKEVWLREFSLRDRHFNIAGNSSNMDLVSDFMKGLEETIYFKGVVLKSSTQEQTKTGRTRATFVLEADRR